MNFAPTTTTHAANMCPLQSLPVDLKTRVASFLNTRSALNLSQTCRVLHDDLQLVPILPIQLISFLQWVGTREGGDEPRVHSRIPLLRHTHSAILTCSWNDQGFGNLKSQIYIVAATQHDDASQPFLGGRLVYESPIAPHQRGKLTVSWIPRSGEDYFLWYKPGGGGGHVLTVRQVNLQMLIFDDSERNWSRNLERMIQMGIVCSSNGSPDSFFHNLFASVARTLETQLLQGGERDSEVGRFLDSCGFELTEKSLVAMQEILADMNVEGVVWVNTDPPTRVNQGRRFMDLQDGDY